MINFWIKRWKPSTLDVTSFTATSRVLEQQWGSEWISADANVVVIISAIMLRDESVFGLDCCFEHHISLKNIISINITFTNFVSLRYIQLIGLALSCQNSQCLTNWTLALKGLILVYALTVNSCFEDSSWNKVNAPYVKCL